MGKLSGEEFEKSAQALREYYMNNNHNHGPFTKTVDVLSKNNKLILSLKPTITIAYDSLRMRINIVWEDDGIKEFRELGLYGYYDCEWVPMEYEDEALIIKSSDSDKIVKVYLEDMY